jgi:hypothetical protein
MVASAAAENTVLSIQDSRTMCTRGQVFQWKCDHSRKIEGEHTLCKCKGSSMLGGPSMPEKGGTVTIASGSVQKNVQEGLLRL